MPPREAEGTLLQREPVRIELGAASGAFAIPVRGRIDRIDGDADGRRILLDYKTGQERNRPKQSAHGINFQLPLYYLAMRTVPGQPVIGACYIDLLPAEVVARWGIRRCSPLPASRRRRWPA
ncbi:MAG: PD-(D/E)XK nuclease family protein [Planctomycetota bacterium]